MIKALHATRVVFALSLLLLLIAGVVATQTPKGKRSSSSAYDCSTVDDPTLTAQVTARIAETTSLAGQDIKVDAKSGVVTLKGNVSSSGKKNIAGRVASRVRCVKKVVNLLVISRLVIFDFTCCCDGECWYSSRPCPTCNEVPKCVQDYKDAIVAAHANKKAQAQARGAFYDCVHKAYP